MFHSSQIFRKHLTLVETPRTHALQEYIILITAYFRMVDFETIQPIDLKFRKHVARICNYCLNSNR